MTRNWTKEDKMMVIIGKMNERIDVLEFELNRLKRERSFKPMKIRR